MNVKRMRRDSNPRHGFPCNGFQDRRLQPLGHSSPDATHGPEGLADALPVHFTGPAAIVTVGGGFQWPSALLARSARLDVRQFRP